MWPLFSHLSRRIIQIFTVNYLNFFMSNFRLNLVEKNDVTFERRYIQSDIKTPQIYKSLVA